MWRTAIRNCSFPRGLSRTLKQSPKRWGQQSNARNHINKFITINPFRNSRHEDSFSLQLPVSFFSRHYSGLATAEEASKIPTIELKNVQNELDELVPLEIVRELDKHIVGQEEAKRAVAIAMRNRWRRQRVPKELQDEIIPKNILMIGPTGCGKTEVARRMAKLINAPFIKVEATKYTEVGFRGKDVDSIISDLLEVAIVQQREMEFKKARPKIQQIVEERLLDLAIGNDPDASGKTREEFRQLLRAGKLEDIKVEYEVPEMRPQGFGMGLMRYDPDEGTFSNIFRPIFVGSNSGRKKFLPIREVRPLMEEEELEKLTKKDSIIKNAIYACEQNGIVFIDEIDKICGDKDPYHADASAEGVQRDLLPIIEGTVVNTRHGNVDTSKILFICAGAFHNCKPSDLLAELQGRLPIRVQLKPLTEKDLYRILTEPQHNLIKQQIELLKTENIDLQFTDAAIKTIAKIAHEINESVENIGARRLYTVIEKVTEEFSFNCGQYRGQKVVVDEAYIEKTLAVFRNKSDLKRFIL